MEVFLIINVVIFAFSLGALFGGLTISKEYDKVLKKLQK